MEDHPCHHLHAIMILCCIYSLGSSSAQTTGNEPDRIALLAIKELINDPLGSLGSWNNSVNFCQWRGVSCSNRHRQRVTNLNLGSQKLEGSLSPYIGNLTFLRTLNLTNNGFSGELPQEIGHLIRLKLFSIRNNMFTSQVPTNISLCSDLRRIDLSQNRFSGKIPTALTTLPKLEALSLAENFFVGNIPPSFGNLSALTQLLLVQNNLVGSIPEDLCHLRNLSFLQLSTNNLTGIVPSCLYNLSSLAILAFTENQLEGTLPPDIGFTLPNLQQVYMALNQLTGKLPVSLTNASRLEMISLNHNSFTGPIPWDLGRLEHLRGLFLSHNQLGTSDGDDLNFIHSLTNCTNFQMLDMGTNFLQGPLPNSIANLSTKMTFLNVGINRVYGHIPPGIENLVNLSTLYFGRNNLTGEIPNGIGELQQLRRLYMQGNGFTGPIPTSLGNLTQLIILNLAENRLQGSIPPSLENCRSLSFLNLSYNNLNGPIPEQVFRITSLKLGLILNHNDFTGSLPSQVGNLTDLTMLVLSRNKLTGPIPDSIGKCITLEGLRLDDNLFEGNIPQSLRALEGVKDLNLSHNKLSGEIPEYLANFTRLTYLNLSFNQLEGQVPNNGVFENESLILNSVDGNRNLCGGIKELQLPPCAINIATKRKRSVRLRVILPTVIVTLCLLLLVSCILLVRRQKRMVKKDPSSTSLYNEQHMRISYAELLKATNSFSADNLIGTGGYGSVFQGFLNQANKVVAVKVLNLQQQGASKSFLAECNVLRNLRHRNLLKVITSCSSVDFQGNDFKALIFEYMPKGNLDEWLHPKEQSQHELKNLNFIQRLDIAIDVASALDYLHQQCQPAIIHCDLKPSNILLSEDMTAHVADFGLSKIFSTSSDNSTQNNTNSVAIKGSIGYVAPEYGMGGEVSMQGDVYSYGILLLEMFTGKRPTNDMFVNGLSLYSYVQIDLPEEVMKIVDPMLLDMSEEGVVTINIGDPVDRQDRMQEILISVMGLGIRCSAELPSERMNMSEVLRKLHHIRDHVK